MTLDSKIYTLDEFKEHDNLEFSQTHINVLYKSFFDSPCHDNSYSYDHCEPDKSYERIKQQHRELYKKFERNLKIITYKTEHYENFETNKDKLCFYLKYWFYDNLISKSVTQDEFENFLALWNEQKSEKCKECDCQFEINKISAIKELKSIYDYFLFTDAYKKISKINNEISKKIYCQYIDNAKIKYSLDKEICAKRSDHYCREFKKYIEKYLVVVEDSSIICNNEENPGTYTWRGNPSDRESPLGKLAESVKGDKDEGAEGKTKDETEYSSLPTPNLHHQHPSRAALSNFRDPAVTLGLPEGASEENTDGLSDHSVPDSSNDGKSTGTIISASSVGTVGFLFLLYKFTPLRSMLDPRIRKTRNNLMNGVQGSNELQSQDYDFYPQDAPFNRYNIGYQSS